MKLIKLISEDIQEGVWKNSLYQPLSIKPGSEVAVKNVSVQFNDPFFTVDDTNNTFTLKTAETASETYFIVLTNGRYRLADLIKEIQLKLNNRLNSINYDKNLMFLVGSDLNLTTNNLRLVISFARKDTMSITEGDCISSNITFGTPNIYKTNTVVNDGTYNAKLFCKTLYSNGGSFLQFNIQNQDTSDIKLSDWFYGIGEQWVYDLNLKDEIIAGLYACFGSSNGKYSYKKDDSMIESTVDITIDDKLTIAKYNGKIKYLISRGSTTVLNVDGDDINQKIPLFGVNPLISALFIGNDTGKIAFSDLKQIPNPFVISSNNLYSTISASDVPDIYLDGTVGGPKGTKITLNFPTPGVRKLLGFSSSQVSASGVSSKFLGDLGLDINLISNNLEIEIDELPIYNYSASTRQIRPIVLTVPASDMRNNIINQGLSFFELSYSENATFLFFDLKIKHEISLPGLTVRILNETGQLIECNGKCSLTLLIKEPNNILE